MELGERQKNLVTALRSGKYKQTINVLRKEDCYCADGVACDISGLGSWKDDAYNIDGTLSRYGIPFNILSYYKLRGSLCRYNDIDKMSFSEIAEILETRPIFYGSI